MSLLQYKMSLLQVSNECILVKLGGLGLGCEPCCHFKSSQLMAVSPRKWALRFVKSSGAGGNCIATPAAEAKSMPSSQGLFVKLQRAPKRVRLGSKEDTGWDFVGKGKEGKGTDWSTQGKGCPQGGEGTEGASALGPAVRISIERRNASIPEHIWGKGITYTSSP